MWKFFLCMKASSPAHNVWLRMRGRTPLSVERCIPKAQCAFPHAEWPENAAQRELLHNVRWGERRPAPGELFSKANPHNVCRGRGSLGFLNLMGYGENDGQEGLAWDS